MKNLTILFITFMFFSNCSVEKQKTCLITGEVVGRNSKTLILKKQTEDSRINKIEIPIDSSGHFNYRLNFQFVEAYELIFEDEFKKGSWRSIMFYPDKDKIVFTLYSIEKFDNNKIVGSDLSIKDMKYNEIIKDKYFSKYVFWNNKMDSLKKISELKSIYHRQVSDSINSIMKEVPQFELEYTKKEMNLYGYSKFLKILRDEKENRLFDIDTLKSYQKLFQKKFPKHPYNEISRIRLEGLMNIKIGGNYVNFTAQDFKENSFTVSDIILKNKFTLIDLWAPWCGPCIKKSRKILPRYKELKEKGFEVIGVIGGVGSASQYKKAIEKHKYPWVLLAEINNQNKLWEKYSISKGGGGQFLINQSGKIIAINPKLDELLKIVLD